MFDQSIWVSSLSPVVLCICFNKHYHCVEKKTKRQRALPNCAVVVARGAPELRAGNGKWRV